MRIRRALVPLVLVASSALSACGGDDGDDDSSARRRRAAPRRSSGDTRNACDLLTADEVAAAVGSPVKEGVRDSGPAVTGGRFSTCVWQSDDPEHPADTATLTIYPNADAADSARSDDAQDVTGIGDQAFTDSFESIWVYVGDESFFAQWYAFDSDDEENAAAERGARQGASADAL